LSIYYYNGNGHVIFKCFSANAVYFHGFIRHIASFCISLSDFCLYLRPFCSIQRHHVLMTSFTVFRWKHLYGVQYWPSFSFQFSNAFVLITRAAVRKLRNKVNTVTMRFLCVKTDNCLPKLILWPSIWFWTWPWPNILNHSFRGVKFTNYLYFYIVDGGHLGRHSSCYLGNQILLYFQQRNKFNLYSTTVKKIISECTIYSCKRNFFVVKWVIFFKIWPLTFNMTLTLTSSMSKTGDKFWLI